MHQVNYIKNFFLNNYLELSIILVCIIVGYLIAWRVHKIIPKFASDKPVCISFKNETTLCFTSVMITNLFIAIILFVGSLMSSTYAGHTSYLANNISKLFAISFVLQFLKNFHNHKPFIKTISYMITLPILLAIFGVLQTILNFLDKLGIVIGEFKLSALFAIKAFYVVVFLIWLGQLIAHFVENKIRTQSDWNPNTREILIKLFNILLYSALFFAGLNFLGISLTALTIFSGALGVGIGLSLQKISSCFLSGLILLFEKTVTVNDIVECASGVKGRIKYLGARTTIIEDYNGNEVVIPNDELINSKIINFEQEERICKVEITLNVSTEFEPKVIRNLLIDAAKAHPTHQLMPKCDCFLIEFGNNSIKYRLEFWNKTINHVEVKSDIMNNIWNKFKKVNINFA